MFQDYKISASVGRSGGVNTPADVIVIQILLNRIPGGQGGPDPQLDVNGKYGQNTQDAIDSFQSHHGLGSDGRIDPGGAMLKRINQLVKEGVPAPAPLPAIPPPGPPSNKAANAIVMGIWGRGGAGDEANPDNGIAAGIERLRPKLRALGVPDEHIWSMSWNPGGNDDFFSHPATGQHLQKLYTKEANPSYVALIGHSYGGRAACLLSRHLNRQPNYVALLDPVFHPLGDLASVIEPRGDVIHNWFQRNGIFVTELEDCLGRVVSLESLLPLGISLGQPIPNAESFEVKFRRKPNGTPEGDFVKRELPCSDGTFAKELISHITIDGDEFIWGQIIKKVINDIQSLV